MSLRTRHCYGMGYGYNGGTFGADEGRRSVEEFILVGLVLVLLLGAYWSMVLFPRQRELQKRQRFARELTAGDEVVTYGGMIGRVIDIDSATGIAQVEIADGVTIRLLTAALIEPYDADAVARAANPAVAAEQSTSVR